MKKNKIIIIGVMVFIIAVISALLPYYAETQAIKRETQAIKKFQTEFQERFKDSLRDPNSLLLDWKIACVNKDQTKFVGLCVVRAKNAMGGYADPILMKIAGIKEIDVFSFCNVEIKDHPFTYYKKTSYDDFVIYEEKEAGKFSEEIRAEISKEIAQEEILINKLAVPKIEVSGFLFDPLSIEDDIPKNVINIDRSYVKAKHVPSKTKTRILAHYRDNKNIPFYKFLLGDMYSFDIAEELKVFDVIAARISKKVSEIDNIVDQREKEEIKKIKAGIKEVKEKAIAERQKTIDREKKEAAAREKEMEMVRKKIVFYNEKVGEMVNEAIVLYKKQHNGELPSKYMIDAYERNIKLYIRFASNDYVRLQEEKNKVSTLQASCLSDREKVELREKKDRIRAIESSLKNDLKRLQECIQCLNYRCKCKNFRFPLEHIKIDYKQDSQVGKIHW